MFDRVLLMSPSLLISLIVLWDGSSFLINNYMNVMRSGNGKIGHQAQTIAREDLK